MSGVLLLTPDRWSAGVILPVLLMDAPDRTGNVGAPPLSQDDGSYRPLSTTERPCVGNPATTGNSAIDDMYNMLDREGARIEQEQREARERFRTRHPDLASTPTLADMRTPQRSPSRRPMPEPSVFKEPPLSTDRFNYGPAPTAFGQDHFWPDRQAHYSEMPHSQHQTAPKVPEPTRYTHPGDVPPTTWDTRVNNWVQEQYRVDHGPPPSYVAEAGRGTNQYPHTTYQPTNQPHQAGPPIHTSMPTFRLDEDQYERLFHRQTNPHRGIFGHAALPKYKVGDDWITFQRAFLHEMANAGIRPLTQLTYLKDCVPSDGQDLLSYNQVGSVGMALKILRDHYDPERPNNQVHMEFLQMKQQAGEAIDHFAARLNITSTKLSERFTDQDRERMVCEQLATGARDSRLRELLHRERFQIVSEALRCAVWMEGYYNSEKHGSEQKKVRVVDKEDVDTNATSAGVNTNVISALDRLTKRLAELETKMDKQQRSNSPPTKSEDKDNEKHRLASNRGRGGRGRGRGGKPRPYCYTCGKQGHISKDCRPDLCFECQEAGHKRKDCPLLQGQPRGRGTGHQLPSEGSN